MTRTHRIDGPKCPACDHRELIVTFEPCFGWGLPDGTSQITHQQCPKCQWEKEGRPE